MVVMLVGTLLEDTTEVEEVVGDTHPILTVIAVILPTNIALEIPIIALARGTTLAGGIMVLALGPVLAPVRVLVLVVLVLVLVLLGVTTTQEEAEITAATDIISRTHRITTATIEEVIMAHWDAGTKIMKVGAIVQIPIVATTVVGGLNPGEAPLRVCRRKVSRPTEAGIIPQWIRITVTIAHLPRARLPRLLIA